ATISRVPGVVSVRPQIEGQVLATANNIATGARVRGVRPRDFRAHKLLATKINAGTLDVFKGKNAVILGHRLAAKLRVKPGDKVTLISPRGNVTAFGTVPRLRAYRVAATFNMGMFEYDSSFVFMPLDAARIFFRTGKAISNLEIMLDDPDRVEEVQAAILRSGLSGIRLVSWRQVNAGFFNALQVERNVMFLILTLIIVVAAFNIISSMIMLVKDKGKDIAILRTMGATRGMIMRIFFMSGASVGVIGTFAGLLLGVAFTENIDTLKGWLESLTGTELFAAEIYFLSHLPAKLDPVEVGQVVGMGLLLSVLATLYPSWRAARLDPVEALRYE
ncbi:MAG: lipoprotein-releasing ABC transporter permease subunit, partial [Alphaproteobacteria bacterium]